MNTPAEVPPNFPPDIRQARSNPDALKQRGGVRAGLALVALGLVLIAGAAMVDARESAEAPWTGTVFSPRGEAPWDGTIPIRARRLPLRNYPIREQIHRELQKTMTPDQLRAIGLDRTEMFLVVYAPAAILEPLLASGRMPRPGYPEVLAGAFTTRNEIVADDGQFQVVGRLKRTTGALATAYVMPADEGWEPLFERTMSWGWLDPDGVEKLATADEDAALDDDAELYGGMYPASLASVWLCLAGLGFAAAGGAMLHRAVFRRVQRGVFGPACRTFTAEQGVVRAMHVFLYGGFFIAAVLALMVPPINVFVMNVIAHAFSEGNLGYVGDAYRSGNLIVAAGATWMNNYLLQTVVMTVLISIVVPCIGVLKTLLSFGLAGLGMAPLWSGTAANYTFHSITMILELEAYIYACAAVVIFWMRIVAAIRRRERSLAVEGARVLVSATLLAGALLAIAGLYEAATLILLR